MRRVFAVVVLFLGFIVYGQALAKMKVTNLSSSMVLINKTDVVLKFMAGHNLDIQPYHVNSGARVLIKGVSPFLIGEKVNAIVMNSPYGALQCNPLTAFKDGEKFVLGPVYEFKVDKNFNCHSRYIAKLKTG